MKGGLGCDVLACRRWGGFYGLGRLHGVDLWFDFPYEIFFQVRNFSCGTLLKDLENLSSFSHLFTQGVDQKADLAYNIRVRSL